jgi:PAS domain S-box-containing protein
MDTQERLLFDTDAPPVCPPQNGNRNERPPVAENGFWDLSPHLLAIVGFDGRVRRLNPSLSELLGVDEDELDEARLLDFVHEQDRGEALAAARDLARGRADRVDLELRVRCRRNAEHTLLGSARACADRELIYVAGSDVTDRRLIERAVSFSQELAVGIGASETVESALELLLRRICEEIGFELGQAWTQAPGASYLELTAAWPNGVSPLERFRSRSACMTFERSKGLPGQAWALRRPVWIDDMKADDAFPRAPFAREAGISAAIAVPVQADGEVVAVLEFFTRAALSRDETIVSLISAAAAQLGTTIVRKRAEQALRRSEERFRLLVDSVEDYAIVMLDCAGHVVSWNQGAERITGYREEEILGYHVSRFYPAEAVDRGEPDLHLSSATRGRPFEQCDWRVRADGLRYRAQVIVTALFNGSPEPHGYSYVIRDVTEQRRVEERLERLGAIVDSSHDAIFSTTLGTQVVTSWNAGAERLFGYTAREMIGRPFAPLIADEHCDAHAEAMRQVVSGHDLEDHEMDAVRKNGGRLQVALTVSPIRDADGQIAGLSSIVHDIGDRKVVEESMMQALGTYLDSEVAQHILREGRGLCAREVDVTMMFIDIRDFTAYAERFEPREVVQTLNCLFELAVPIITERGGHVDKFVGDGLLAVFGAPKSARDHADRAVEAAFLIAQQAQERFEGDLEIGIGLDSGSVVTGNVGGGGRLDFTVIGDAVNTAARIEAATRITGDAILISDQTRRRLWRAEVSLTTRPPVEVKGKRQPVAVYVPHLQLTGSSPAAGGDSEGTR